MKFSAHFCFILITIASVHGNNLLKILRSKEYQQNSRIVGGHNTTIEEVPYQASVRYYGIHTCGGAIINENTVLSGAHCFDVWDFDNFRRTYTIRVGSTSSSHQGGNFKVANIVKHPEFNASAYYFDIAVIKLTTKLTFGPNIQAVSLPRNKDVLVAGTIAIVSGWGALSWKGEHPDQLQMVKVPVIDQELCAQVYADVNPIPCHSFCAGSFSGDMDSCSGDSGGPLVVNNTLIGLVSWGIECAVPGYPGVYTNIAKLRCWIDKFI